jgi:hypothetical protein
MPRARNIKPGLFKNVDLAELPIEARYLFPGLWTLADCEGRLKDQPKWIKAEIYPYDRKISAARLHELLQLLADAGFLTRYVVDSCGYIQISNWHKHQRPHKKERDTGSQIPPQPGAKPDPAPEKPDLDPPEIGASPADTGYRIPDTGYRIPDTGYQGPARTPPPTANNPRDGWRTDESFQHLVTAYRESGAACIDEDFAEAWLFAWKKLDFEQRLQRVTAFKERVDRGVYDVPKMIPRPRKFIEQEWRRPIPASEPRGQSSGTKYMSADEYERRFPVGGAK